MGFFSDLREDLSQAVNELVPDDKRLLEKAEKQQSAEKASAAETIKEVPVQEIDEISIPDITERMSVPEEIEEVSVPETAEDLSRMWDDMELDAAAEQKEKGLLAMQETEEDSVRMREPEEEDSVGMREPEETEATDKTVPESAEIMEASENMKNTEVTESMERTDDLDEKTMWEDDFVEEAENGEFETEELDDLEDEDGALDETAVITAGMKIKGDISSRGSIDVIGAIEGNIDVLGKLNITGNIEGSSKAAEVYAEKARINGDIHSVGSIKIGQSSIIIGNIFATSAVIAGAVKGDIDVKGPVILDTSAIVMGNIKSKSVQINNGAVIEGLCSQCYAEVSPSSFFEDIKKTAKK